MKYDELLAKQLMNPDGYLYFPESSIHSYLDGIAHDAFSRGQPEGYMAALSIWHQLTEEILRLLYRYSQLLIKAALYPVILDEKAIENESMGALIQIHKQCVVYDRKSLIIRYAGKINDLRNELFHWIIRHPTEADIVERAKPAQDHFESIFKEWHEAMKWFYRELDKTKKRTAISMLLQKYQQVQ
jgi:hypothetical protein